jgi:hypothetical protein
LSVAISRIKVCARVLSFQKSAAEERDSISATRFDFPTRSKTLPQASDARLRLGQPVFQWGEQFEHCEGMITGLFE